MIIKELPNAKEVECAIISAIILTPNSIYNCIQLLNEECFYYHNNRILWNTLLDIHKTGKVIDTVNVFEHLRSNNKLDQIGGMDALLKLTSRLLPFESLVIP